MEIEEEIVGEGYGIDICTLSLTLKKFENLTPIFRWFDLIWTVHLSNA